MLEIRDLSVCYGAVQALSSATITVREGEITSIIGANGAGKTTLLQAISGLITVKSGSIRFMGDELPRKPNLIVARGIVHVPEGRKVFPNMSVYENLLMGAYSRRDDFGADLEYVYNLFPILEERSRQPAGTLSGGEQQMLAVARGIMAKPRLLLLDEPSLGLAPILIERLFQAIIDIHSRGIPVLLVEQNASQALAISDHGYVLETGRVVMEGTGGELLDDPGVRQAYLGARTGDRRREGA
ncbi:MAG: ABC transporter ATP-binding protein [Firmicutes bacterium]|nr:ABC transporter ATP-binding protein [Bacillota bacterium]